MCKEGQSSSLGRGYRRRGKIAKGPGSLVTQLNGEGERYNWLLRVFEAIFINTIWQNYDKEMNCQTSSGVQNGFLPWLRRTWLAIDSSCSMEIRWCKADGLCQSTQATKSILVWSELIVSANNGKVRKCRKYYQTLSDEICTKQKRLKTARISF